jgi:hypothetical protein
LRFIRLDSESGGQVDYIDLGNVVHVHQTNAEARENDVLEVQIHFAGGASLQLGGALAEEFLRQFRAYVERLNLQSGGPGPSGPGHSALSF